MTPFALLVAMYRLPSCAIHTPAPGRLITGFESKLSGYWGLAPSSGQVAQSDLLQFRQFGMVGVVGETMLR